jgi:aspartate kinase
MIMPTIMKFGGTSVADANALENVAQIIANRVSSVPVVVVSAMSGVTDTLLNSTAIASEARCDAAIASLNKTFERHIATAEQILSHDAASAYAKYASGAQDQIAYFLKLIDSQLAQFQAVQDATLAFGETLSSLLLANLLSERGVPAIQLDARECVITDDNFGAASPLMSETAEATRSRVLSILETGTVPVLGGFIDSNLDRCDGCLDSRSTRRTASANS